MSGDEDEGKAAAAAGGDVVSPSAKYQPFVVMEELLDKLKLLHYEDSFCRQLGHKPFSRWEEIIRLYVINTYCIVFLNSYSTAHSSGHLVMLSVWKHQE